MDFLKTTKVFLLRPWVEHFTECRDHVQLVRSIANAYYEPGSMHGVRWGYHNDKAKEFILKDVGMGKHILSSRI